MRTMSLLFAGLTLGWLTATATPANAQQEVAVDVHQFAAVQAQQIATSIREVQGTRVSRVAVFPFGDAEGRASAAAGELPITLQGELIHQLTQQAVREERVEFTVLSAATVNRALGGQSAQGVGVTREETTEILQRMEVDFAIVGHVEFTSVTRVLASETKTVRVNMTLAPQNPQLQPLPFNGELDAFDALAQTGGGPLNPGGGPRVNGEVVPGSPTGRFLVQILDPNGNPLPMQVCNDPDSEFHNVYFLILPEAMRNQPYQILVANSGGPPVGYANQQEDRDPHRLFQVAVLVDGVNSIFEKTAEGSLESAQGIRYEPVTRHPSYVSRWVLTGPGARLAPDPMANTAELAGAQLVPAPTGQDGSFLRIKGFQIDEVTAREFVFTNAQESIAVERRLFTNEVGLIAVHFYAQQFAQQDQVEPWLQALLRGTSTQPLTLSDAGTKEGRPLPNETFHVAFPVYKNPVQVWRIFYRYEGQPLPLDRGQPLAPSSLQPVPVQ